MYKSLEVLEAWVRDVRHLMWEEPQRMLDGKSHPPSVIEVQDMYCACITCMYMYTVLFL